MFDSFEAKVLVSWDLLLYQQSEAVGSSTLWVVMIYNMKKACHVESEYSYTFKEQIGLWGMVGNGGGM